MRIGGIKDLAFITWNIELPMSGDCGRDAILVLESYVQYTDTEPLGESNSLFVLFVVGLHGRKKNHKWIGKSSC